MSEQLEGSNARKVIHDPSRVTDLVDADRSREQCEDSPPPKRVCLRQADVLSESQKLIQQLVTKLCLLVHTERTENIEELGIAIS